MSAPPRRVPVIDVTYRYAGSMHYEWAEGVARRIAKAQGFARGSQEESDIVGTALQTLCQCAVDFDLGKLRDGANMHAQFRSWAGVAIKWDCLRECARLRNGGLYRHGTEQTRGVVCEQLADDAEIEYNAHEEYTVDSRGENRMYNHGNRRKKTLWFVCDQCGNRAKLTRDEAVLKQPPCPRATCPGILRRESDYPPSADSSSSTE